MSTTQINFDQLDSLKFLEETTEEDIIGCLLTLFDIQYQEICPQLRQLIKSKSFNEASSLAHKLKSSAIQLGMNDVAQSCLFLETECKKKNEHDYDEVIKKIIQDSSHSIEIIQKYTGKTTGAAA